MAGHGTDFKHFVVIVTGGRNYKNRDAVFRELSALCGPVTDSFPLGDTIVHVRVGDCPTGADAFADEWCIINTGNVPQIFKADWNSYGRRAGPYRNQDMCAAEPKADLCLAFPGGRGTKNCVSEALKRGIKVKRINL